MKAFKDLQATVQAGHAPIVTFKKCIEDKECYPEAGMRGRIRGVSLHSCGEVFHVDFDFSEFDAHNKVHESPNYYDRAGIATLTAREAGHYKPQEGIYFDVGEDLTECFEVEPASVSALLAEYAAIDIALRPGTYTQWLEAQVLDFRSRA